MRVCVLSYADVLPAGLHALRRAAAAAGVDLDEVEPHALRVHLGPRPSVTVDGRSLRADAVLHRTVHPYRGVVVPALRVLAGQGVAVLNDPDAALVSRDKGATLLALSAAGLPTVPTVLTASPPSPADVAGLQAREYVLKPARGAQGRDVRRVRADALADVAEGWAFDPQDGPTLVQPYLEHRSDLRAFAVDGRCVAVGTRTAAPGEWRCNLALGGRAGRVQDPALEAEATSLAVRAVAGLGLDYGAVDLLVDAAGRLLVSEVDAWGGFAGLGEAVQVDVAAEVLRLAARRAGAAT